MALYMRLFYSPIFLPVIVMFFLAFSATAYMPQVAELPISDLSIPKIYPAVASGAITAKSFLVFDLITGEVLLEKNKSKVVPIASVTKLFSASTLVSDFDIEATTTIEWSDIVGGGAAGKLALGEEYTYHNLLFPLLLESSNDAAATLLRDTAGDLLVKMNERAQSLGATATVFSDASGLKDTNVSTAQNLQLLLTGAFRNEPHVFDITTLPQYVGIYTGWVNNNPVAKEVGFKGGKHGYTTAANRTLVAVFNESSQGHKYTLGYIILGSEDIAADFKLLRASIQAGENY